MTAREHAFCSISFVQRKIPASVPPIVNRPCRFSQVTEKANLVSHVQYYQLLSQHFPVLLCGLPHLLPHPPQVQAIEVRDNGRLRNLAMRFTTRLANCSSILRFEELTQMSQPPAKSAEMGWGDSLAWIALPSPYPWSERRDLQESLT
jgi:hypothetical protein